MIARSTEPDTHYMSHIRFVPFDPVFIIGPHRSGTTILYKALMESGCFNVTTAYHVLRHDRLLHAHFNAKEQAERDQLRRLFAYKGLTDRQFDAMPITPDIPEEYCYALPRQGRRPMVRANNRQAFLDLCRKVQLIQQPNRPLLLKNPFDTINFIYLARILPHAKFIINHRNPVDVINSQMKALRGIIAEKNEYVALVIPRYRKMWESPLKRSLARALYGGKSPVLFRQVEQFIRRNNDYLTANAPRIEDRAIHVRYLDLCQDPNGALRRILEFVGVAEAAPVDYTALIQPRSSALVQEVDKNRSRILKRNQEYCHIFDV